MYELPYAVLEVKLQGDTPLWMTSMLSSGKLVESFKFSKYSQGICALGHLVDNVRCAALRTRCAHFFCCYRPAIPLALCAVQTRICDLNTSRRRKAIESDCFGSIFIASRQLF